MYALSLCGSWCVRVVGLSSQQSLRLAVYGQRSLANSANVRSVAIACSSTQYVEGTPVGEHDEADCLHRLRRRGSDCVLVRAPAAAAKMATKRLHRAV